MFSEGPKSASQSFQSLDFLHRLIVNFVKANKDELKRGFAFTAHPSDKMLFYTLLELQEDPDLIGCNEELRAQFLNLIGTYDFNNSYVYIIRVDNEPTLRFIAQTGPLEEDGVEQIISYEEIQEREEKRLKIGMFDRIIEHKVARGAYRLRKQKKWRWPVQFVLKLMAAMPGQELVLSFWNKI